MGNISTRKGKRKENNERTLVDFDDGECDFVQEGASYKRAFVKDQHQGIIKKIMTKEGAYQGVGKHPRLEGPRPKARWW